jgi:hypothetical protein
VLVAAIIGAIVIAILLSKRQKSEGDNVDGDDICGDYHVDPDIEMENTTTPFGVSNHYVSQEGLSADGHHDAVVQEDRNSKTFRGCLE